MKVFLRVFSAVLCVLLSVGLSSCRFAGQGSEPESIYAVSAVGLDRSRQGGFRLTLELPPVNDKEEAVLLHAEGASLDQILEQLLAGQSKRLLFDHCAVLVLGEELTWEQLRIGCEFFCNGELLPLAAQILSAKSAEELLSCRFSLPVAGYALPGILRRQKTLLGLEAHNACYELLPKLTQAAVALPFFSVTEEGEETRAAFAGLTLLRRAASPMQLSLREAVSYALLTDRFAGSSGQPGGAFPSAVRQRTNKLQLQEDSGEARLVLSLELFCEGAQDSELSAQLQKDLTELFARLHREGLGLACLSERLTEEERLYFEESEASADDKLELFVECKISEQKRGME